MKQDTATQFDPVGAAPAASDNTELGLLDLFVILAASKRLLFFSLLAGGVLSAVIAFCLPNTYTAAAVIVTPQQPQSTMTALLGQLAPLAAMTGRDLGIKALAPGEQFVALLQSRTVADNLIGRFGLKSIYEAKTGTDAREKLKARSSISVGKGALITIAVSDTDPNRAAALASAYVDELSTLNSRFVVSEAGERRAFLEARLNNERKALAEAEEAFKKSQGETGIVHIESQAHVTLAAIAQIRAQIAAGEVAVQQLRLGATADNPMVVQYQTEIEALRAQLQKLESKSSATPGDPLVPTGALPQAGLEYLRRLRDLKYHEFLFEMLSKQYEAACLDESKAAPAIQIVDRPSPPDKKSGPYRTLIVLGGVLLTAFLLTLHAWIQFLLAKPAPEHKLQLLWATMMAKKNGGPLTHRNGDR